MYAYCPQEETKLQVCPKKISQQRVPNSAQLPQAQVTLDHMLYLSVTIVSAK